MTSPPFPLNRKKKYGNFTGDEYLKWLASYAQVLASYLSESGSIVIEMGNAWNKGHPTTSTLPLEALLAFKKAGNLHLCQEFVHYNPARLPSPVEWVNKQRIRVKDAFTRFWWLSTNPRPFADNRQVLQEYSQRMRHLLKSGSYNCGKRPSEHKIGERSFLNDNGGAIPANVLIASNTGSNDAYGRYCRDNGLRPHPARMPMEIAEFFIRFLTSEGDLVLDPFAGSNTTGAAAERLKRRWIAIETDKAYAASSIGRF